MTENTSSFGTDPHKPATDPTAAAAKTAGTTTTGAGTEKAIDEIKVKAEELFDLIKKNAGPLFNDLKSKVEPLIADLKEKAPHYVEQAKQKAQPLIDDVSAKLDEVRNKNASPAGAASDDVQNASQTVTNPGVSTPGESSAASSGGTTASVAEAHKPGTNVDGTPGQTPTS